MQLHARREFKVEKLSIKIYETRQRMGIASAGDLALIIRKLLKTQDEVAVIFTAAPSQKEFLTELSQIQEIEWSRVVAFLVDEFVGLPENAPQGFGFFLKKALWDNRLLKAVYFIHGNLKDLKAECQRYSQLLKKHPVDIACLGIGENGHIAFNDPTHTEFNDSEWVRIIEMTDISRQQHANDGLFGNFENVPTHVITLTVPALLKAKYLVCMIPSKAKISSIKEILTTKISGNCPASILRTHEAAVLYLEQEVVDKLAFHEFL